MKSTSTQSTAFSAIVIEDSRLAREGLMRMLKDFSQINIVGDADHPATALELIQQYKPDLLFLDIHMPGSSGFDLLEQLDYSPLIIFTTAYSEYAIRSFDYHTIDYLMKPVSQTRLGKAIDKLAIIDENVDPQNTIEELRPVLEFKDKLFVKDGEYCHLVALDSIRYFESCKNYVIIYFDETKAFIKKSLSQVESRLPKKYFFRISRQFVINLHEVKCIDLTIQNGYEITMMDNKTLDVSRRNGEDLKTLLSF
ncbi:MAG: two-component system LytT family response regulator [Paraglaciecola sp.]|jgi:two-component system LytT family response regulator